MQDRYVGDIGDFANNGLLRYLCGVTSPPVDNALHLGVVWYRTELGGPDGNRIEYLNVSDSNDSMYRECDPELYDTLRKLVGESLVKGEKRNIGQISDSLILPADTQYYDVTVPVGERNNWLKGALEKTSNADLVFINPDKGIASNNQANSLEHVTMDDVRKFANEGTERSLVIYQHVGQGMAKGQTAADWISDHAKCLEVQLGRKVWALWWRRFPNRTYFIVAQPSHVPILHNRIEKLLASPWGTIKPPRSKNPHFTLGYPMEGP